MRFSIFNTVHDTSDVKTLGNCREQCVLTDKLGCRALWISKHQEIGNMDEILVGYAHHRVLQSESVKSLELFVKKAILHFHEAPATGSST